MPFTVEIVTGPAAGRKFDIPDGIAVTFGRTEKARCVIQNDSHLSGTHFSLESRGGKCKIRDLSSTNGTFIDGARITESSIGLNGIFAAGSCTFQLRAAVEEWVGFSSRHKTVLSLLYGYNEPVFAILDAARENRLPAFLRAYGVEHFSLSERGPFVALLPKSSQLIPLLMKEGWGKGWGVYFNSEAELPKLGDHLHKVMTARDEDGGSLYAGFYDPRILRLLIPNSTPEERGSLFGPISRFVVEGDDLDHPLQFRGSSPFLSTSFDRAAFKP